MNATIPSFKAPVSNNPPSGSPPVDTEKNGTGPDFAGALCAAAGKSSRKSVPNKAAEADSGGGTLPVPGSSSPAAATTPLAATAIVLSLPINVSAADAPPVAGAAGVIQQAVGGTPQPAGQSAQAPGLMGTAGVIAAPPLPAATEAQGDAVTTLAAAHAADPPADTATTAATGESRIPSRTPATDAAAGSSGAANRTSAADTGNDSATDGVSGTGTLPAASGATPATAQSTNAVAVDMALAEGADATGAAATAVQASVSATTAAVTPMQGLLVQSITGLSGSPPSVPQVATAALAAADTSALANPGDADKHAHGGGGDAALGGGNGSDATAVAQQLSSSTSSTGTTDGTSAPSFKMNAGVDSAEFPQGLADRVSFMIDNNLNGAKLQVNPPQLGPIELQIAVQGDHAQVSMSTHSAVTREALESSLPKLREMLGAQGFGQVSVDISQRSFQERSATPQPYEWTSPAERAASPAPISHASSRASLGALDTYA